MLNKKGDVFQLLFVLIICFISAIVGLLFLTMTSQVNQFWSSSGLLVTPNNTVATDAQAIIEASSVPATDYMIFFLFLGANIGLMISAVKTKFSPSIVFFFILLLIITIFIASGIVNIYHGFSTTDATSSVASQLTLTNFVFSRYTPLIMTGIGIMIMLIMWGKSGGDIIG